MRTPIVHSLEPIVLVGGGNVHEPLGLDTIRKASTVVAADGGAETARRLGVLPAAVIGDFDSLSAESRGAIPEERLHHIAEQDSTDFDKALRHIAAPVVLAVGFTGARFDHQLAVLHVLTKYPDRPCLVLGETEVSLLCPPVLEVPLQAGEIVSLFPMGAVTGRSDGLRWPIEGLAFDPLTQIGTSNAATGPIRLKMDAPHMIVMLPLARLDALIQALVLAPPDARWPARA